MKMYVEGARISGMPYYIITKSTQESILYSFLIYNLLLTYNRFGTYMKDNIEHLQMKFYLQGTRNQATVQADLEKRNGRFEYSYLSVKMRDYPWEEVTIIDNSNSEANEV